MGAVESPEVQKKLRLIFAGRALQRRWAPRAFMSFVQLDKCGFKKRTQFVFGQMHLSPWRGMPSQIYSLNSHCPDK
jgi:hypothetical protein